MRKQRPVAAVLFVDVLRTPKIVERVEQVESRYDVRARCAAGPGNDLQPADGAGPGDRQDTGRAPRRIEARQTAAGDDPAGSEAAIILAEPQIVGKRQVFVRVISADQPVELVVESRALQPQFLGERLKLAETVAIVGTIEDIDRAEVEIAILDGLVAAIAGDRRQLGAAEVVIDLHRDTGVGRLALVAAVRSDPDVAAPSVVERLRILRIRTNVGQDVDDVVAVHQRRVVDGKRRRIVEVANIVVDVVVDIDRAAALFLAPRIVADQADAELVVRLIKQLSAREPAIAVVDVGVIGVVLIETVALDQHAFQPEGQVIADRAGNPAREPAIIEVADRRFAIAAEGERRLLGKDVKDARRSVAAEQRALRTAKHFDAVDFAQLVEADA